MNLDHIAISTENLGRRLLFSMPFDLHLAVFGPDPKLIIPEFLFIFDVPWKPFLSGCMKDPIGWR